MLATHLDAENRYSRIRREAFSAATEILGAEEGLPIRLTEINTQALNAYRKWEKSEARIKDWDWMDGYSVFKHRYPKRFEVALWESMDLIGLSLGRPTFQGTALRLDIVEAAPLDLGNRPSIFGAVLIGYGVYARLINAREIRIMNPVNEHVRAYYEQFNYKYVESGDYLYKGIY